MNNLTITNDFLPTTIKDLASFVLIGREKLVSVRAEIRAIDKLNLAENVRQQKRDEAQMLSEALLDAEVRIGELLKQVPKTSGGDRRSANFKIDSGVVFEKPKNEVVQSLGFSEKQANRFETLASNPDIVEQVKAEARENEDIPTRSRVLQLVKEKNRVAPPANEDALYRDAKEIDKAILLASALAADIPTLQCWASVYADKEDSAFEMTIIDMAIEKLQYVKAFLTNGRLQPKLKAR